MRFAVCDNCGRKDDCAFEKNHPILDGGVLLQFRVECNPGFEAEMELCFECRQLLLKAFPKLVGVLRFHKGELSVDECAIEKSVDHVKPSKPWPRK